MTEIAPRVLSFRNGGAIELDLLGVLEMRVPEGFQPRVFPTT